MLPQQPYFDSPSSGTPRFSMSDSTQSDSIRSDSIRSDSIHVVCGQCDSIVRVPSARTDQAPQCPKCHASIFDGHPITLRTASFDKHASRNDLPLVVDVWAPWCGPCRMMAPHFEEAARRFGTQARFAKINSDEEPSLSARFGIRGIPTLLVFKKGKEIARQSGAMDLGNLTRWLQQALN
jgi:thioredoxin 2